MPTILCICQKCGDRFYVKDLYSPASSNQYKTIKLDKTPVTWDEWLMHVGNFCEKCRIKEVPESCLKDYHRLKGK